MFTGQLVGFLVLTIFGDYLGRWWLMFSNLLISLGGLMICVFGESIEMVTAGLLFAISGARNAFVICFNFLTETMTENLREKSSVLIQIFFGVGVLGNTIWYYLL